MLEHETATFRAADGWRWEFDITFMLSGYHCIWGQGCHDTLDQHSDRGCCADGVEVYQGEGDAAGAADLEKLRGHLAEMTDDDWQNRQVALRRDGPDPWGKPRFARDSVHTRIYRGACIFHNRTGHPGGSGCAFHVAALRRGEHPADWKPETCWRVPLFAESDDEAKLIVVRPTEVADWGEEGILDWWCTHNPEAFGAQEPVYVSMEYELRRICGDAIYDELAAYCAARNGGQPRKLTLLPMAS